MRITVNYYKFVIIRNMESASTQVNSLQIVNNDEIDDEYDADSHINLQLNSYITTTLIATRNITLADILLTMFNNTEFE